MLDWTHFTTIDWVIFAVVGVSVLLSLWRGFLREAVSLAGWVAAFVVANMFAARMAVVLAPWIGNLTGQYVAAYALLFVGTLVTASLLGRIGVELVRISGLSLLDRLLGTVFGFARGVILVLVAVYLLRQLFPPQNLQALHQSQLMPQIDMLVQWAQLVFARFGQDLGAGLAP